MNTSIFKSTVFFALLLLVSACNRNPEITDAYLDGALIQDSSIAKPEFFLVSYKYVEPDSAMLETPVLITAHGYTASTFEWMEFEQFAKQKGGVLVSRVLLGGHGRDYETFKKSTWYDWQQPVIDEYIRLNALGYRNISLAGSSTGCPLIFDMLFKGICDSLIAPRNIIFIDPIVEPTNKLLKWVGILKFVVPYTEVAMSEGELPFWYRFRPAETLYQLHKLTQKVRSDLKTGIVLPEGTQMAVFKVTTDDSAHPVSAKMLYDGITLSDGGKIDTFMMNSNLHVFTRLQGRDSFSSEDIERQQKAFNYIYEHLVSKR
jgi:carboxylesterase